ncbi:hypothetical protein [Candidatus Electrothrix sp.]|uniref:hypothetical protein n=1 Tax=Candidatus Electrothrix sp. TaxID=2170559 RepID=UPI00405621AC
MSNSLKQRRVLLVEPGYRNKYPPLGLMKLAAYHRNRGDYVRFFKGDLRKLVIELYTETVIEQLYSIDDRIDWKCHAPIVAQFIRYGRKTALAQISELGGIFSPSIIIWLKYYNKAYRAGRVESCASWDRICVTSLFTFYFKRTIETIEYCKKLVSDESNVLVGGVMASLIPDEVEEATGIRPIIGLLDTPGMLDEGDTTIIDQLPPDYSILEEIDYTYPEHDGYYGYTSRGCIRKCEFCAVPVLEPVFKGYLPISEQLEYIDRTYGARRNLLLLDNNVLASKRFPEIIQQICANGFYKGAKFVSPNYLQISIANLKSGINEFAYRRLAHSILIKFRSRLSGATLKNYLRLLEENEICAELLPTSDQLTGVYEDVKELYEDRRNKASKYRYVDFNQGVDARLLTEEKMALLATIPIKPLRIAFDSMKLAKPYEKAIRLAAKYNIKQLSNYLLFNHKDRPVELYQRMRINVELSNELDLQIYSFPMRFSPIWDDNKLHHGRTYIGNHWNRKFIRSIQTVLNATKGKVGTKLDFFKAAFGKDENEFFEILYMPEAYILHRRLCEKKGLTDSWRKLYQSMSNVELNNVLPIIERNNFSEINGICMNNKLKCLLKHYQISPKDLAEDGFGYGSVDR